MKGRVIVLNNTSGMAALVVDGRLDDLLADGAGAAAPRVGAIYWGVIDRIAGGSAFVRLTPAHAGFLRDARGCAPGQVHLVQVNAEAEPGKAVPVTASPLFKGRFAILTPGAPGLNISRRIRAPEAREDLRARTEALLARRGIDLVARGAGLILRSAAARADDAELAADLDRLLLEEARTEDQLRDVAPPLDHPVAGHRTPLIRALDEWGDPVPDAIVADSAILVDGARHNPLPLAGTGRLERMVRHEPDPFDRFGVWDAIERLKSSRADLPSGSWMAVEATRAMVTVDVNTGDQFNPGAAMTANIEAARELPRQLRLRGLGGQITVDFAPLKKMHRKRIEETLKAAFRDDQIATTLAGWTPLGNFELQRKRERRPLTDLA